MSGSLETLRQLKNASTGIDDLTRQERPQAAETGEMFNFRKKIFPPAIIKNALESELNTKSIDYRTSSSRYPTNDESSMFASRSSSIGKISKKNISCEILRRKQLGQDDPLSNVGIMSLNN